MHSIEKYIANLLCDFFYNHKGDFALNISKEVLDFVNNNSNIHFENLSINCYPTKSGFKGVVNHKSLHEKIEFEFNVK